MADREPSKIDRVITFMNTDLFPDSNDLSGLPDIYKEFQSKFTQLEQQLSFATKEAPGKIQTAVAEAEESTQSVGSFKQELEQLHGDICNHSADSTTISKKLVTLTNQIDDLKQYSTYLQWISTIDDLSADIQSALIVESQERAIEQFNVLVDLACNIQSSQCRNLVEFANASVMFWYKILKEKLTSEFDGVLNAWGWPFIISTVNKAKSSQQNEADVKKKLNSVFTFLLRLQLPEALNSDSQQQKACVQIPGWRPLLLPLQHMLLPLKKRFRYHFFGNRQTNTLDKPEWYFTQTLTWIRDHRDFLETRIQPILDKAGKPGVIAVVEFCRGLVTSVIDKMQTDLGELMFDDHQFCHLVDEALAFDRELQEVYGYPTTQPSCLAVLTQPDPFHKWIHIEHKNAVEKMDAMLDSPTAWQSQYKGVVVPEAGTDSSDLKVPECAETFGTLMTTILERYRGIRSVEPQVRFVGLQLELLEDYRERLVQVKGSQDQPLAPTSTAILNAVSYVLHMLHEWEEQPFFVELHYWKCHGKADSYLGEKKAGAEKPALISADMDADQQLPMETSSEVSQQEGGEEGEDLRGIQGSLFEGTKDLLAHMQRQMLGQIVSYVFDDVKARSRAYRKDKWLAVPSQKDLVSLSLSATACEMLLVLREHLLKVQEALTNDLFTTFWQDLATHLDDFIFTELIKQNHFSEGGAAQLNFDMTRNLFPLFSQFTTKPENYFRDVKESLILLTLKPGNILLLRGILNEVLHGSWSKDTHQVADPVAALHDLRVFKLTLEQAELVLSLRVDVTGS